MCWNSQVSLLTFIIGVVVTYTLFKRNKPYDKVIGVFILFLIVLLALVFYNTTYPYNYVCMVLLFISFLFSYYKYKIQESNGRFWCYFAAYAPVIFLFLKR